MCAQFGLLPSNSGPLSPVFGSVSVLNSSAVERVEWGGVGWGGVGWNWDGGVH